MKKAVMSLYLSNKSMVAGWKQLSENAVRSFMYSNKGFDGYIFSISNFQTEKALNIISLFEAGYDCVVCLDADTFTIAECDEMLEPNIDIYGSMNVPNLCHTNCKDLLLIGGDTITSDTGSYYINAGVLCFHNMKAVIDWWFLNSTDPFKVWEQDYINLIFHSGKYKTKILDIDSVCYNETGREQWMTGHFERFGNNIILNDTRKLKILHWAGGYDKAHFTTNNRYLTALPEKLKDLCLLILSKSNNIKLFDQIS